METEKIEVHTKLVWSHLLKSVKEKLQIFRRDEKSNLASALHAQEKKVGQI